MLLLPLALLACTGPLETLPASDTTAPVAAPEPAPKEAPPPPVWPAAGAPLTRLPAPAWDGPPLRVVVDAGHGAPGNLGNTGFRCEREADFTRRAQDAVLARLGSWAALSLRAGRPTEALVPYDDRIAAFHAWDADAVLSLHSDTRAGDGWTLSEETGCYAGTGAPGFSVLY